MDPTSSPVPLPSDRAYSFLFERINYERGANISYRTGDFRLERMHELTRMLGDPHRKFPIIHIAGTKGKGSTAILVAAVLRSAGLRVGLYTSPHLERLEERFVVDDAPCSTPELTRLINVLRAPVEWLDRRAGMGQRGPTFFEITTAMAFQHFAESRVDVAVVEVGLGGRLDSTNVCHPVVTAITSISLDHTKQLGNTLEKIAAEKAGIIKPAVPIICGVLQRGPQGVIEATARQRGAPLWRLGREFHAERTAAPPHALLASGEEPTGPGRPRAWMDYWEPERPAEKNQTRRLRQLELGLFGEHQVHNAGVAVAAIERLRELGWRIPDEAVRRGLVSAHCPARIEVLAEAPTVILDVAHNLASIAALLRVLDEQFGDGRRILIFAASQDKDAEGMLRLVAPHFQHIILTSYHSNPRGVPPSELRRMLGERPSATAAWPEYIETRPDAASSWRAARQRADAEDLICITGSFFLAAEIRPALGSSWAVADTQACERAGV